MKLGLALSGGGLRAAVFHLGVLRHLAERRQFEAVEQVSTVSGGSLILGAVIAQAGNQWPSSQEFSESTYPVLRDLLISQDLFSFDAIGWLGLLRFNHRILHDRARILSLMLQERWGVTAKLGDLPDKPVWWINATCFETGKNWRFSKREMGDWQFGRHYTPPFLLADAMASSAAVPYVIGALKFELPVGGWYRTDPATRKPVETIRVAPSVNLWDGGAYENLGLEPLYKPKQGLIGCDFLICSDASAPLTKSQPGNQLSRLARGGLASPRLFDIASDQIRALRSRMLVSAIESRSIKAVLVKMGNSTRTIDIKCSRLRDASEYDRFLTDTDVAGALAYPTNLARLSALAFDQIARHGYEAADCILTGYAKTDFSLSMPWPIY